MRTRLVMAGISGVAWALLACAGGGPPEPNGPAIAPGTPAEGEAPAPVSTAPVPVPVGGTPTAGEAPAPPVSAVPDYCTDDCLLLLEHDFGDLQDGKYCDLCGPHVEAACEFDWPSSDVMPCERYDWLRNCIYARLGYEFDTAREWRKVFDQEPWYQPNPRFSWSDVNAVQASNAKALKRIVSKRQCAR